jgi:membrane protein implicated in regulation of membrane protease activity
VGDACIRHGERADKARAQMRPLLGPASLVVLDQRAASVAPAMVLILTLILALVFLPWPWSGAAIVISLAWEIFGAVLSIRYSRRGRAWVGVETLVGTTAFVIMPLMPDGQVRVNGEIWRAHSEHDASVGETVLIRAVNGLTLEVEPDSAGGLNSSLDESRPWRRSLDAAVSKQPASCRTRRCRRRR